ncbi:RBOHF [Symbiodinium pilosum]|uniref:RBOHF protein n=1 Tax=Symbiodinium pilosum TaxID=2952 RepID=A0A812IMM0_SYMPI|nr:RBOHF [Symbiodinium pilosum]
MTFTEAAFLTMPGLTGVLLTLVLVALALTSQPKFRALRFEIFSKIHTVGIVTWPILLFLHGSQGWVGIGIPLVLVVCGLPILLYVSARLARLLRYYLNSVRVLRAVVRPGPGKTEAEGALVQLELSRPRCLWRWKGHAGMYAFICMPEYALWQWHPMTITSGSEDSTVNFLVAGIGDWTQELAKRCLSGRLPRLALDGPFTAPTQSALDKRVLVAVGAGVGVTPFISLLSTLVSELVSESKQHRLVEAHFYWMTRDPMEFVFAWQILRKWLRHDILQSKIFIHLYTTAPTPGQNLPAFLFHEAVKRQCLVDRRYFKGHLAQWLEQRAVQTPGPQFPWAWAEGRDRAVIPLGSSVLTRLAHGIMRAAHDHPAQQLRFIRGFSVLACKPATQLARKGC